MTAKPAEQKSGVSHWFRELLRLDAEESIVLNEGEELLTEIGRHWVLLLAREIPPVFGLLFFGGLALYRAAGGGFLVTETGQPTGIDFVNGLLLALAGILFVFLAALWARRSKDTRARNVLLLAMALVIGLAYFRYNGGRIFFIDPSLFTDQAGDFFNVILMILATICAVFVLFTFYDWLNDELILTTQRVIYDNDQVIIPRLLEQRVQEQIYIDDVQDVVATTKTYPQHWLKYGTIIVKSARFRGELRFDQANDPKRMQRRIMDVVNSRRKERSEKALETMVEVAVYNAPKDKPVFRRDIKVSGGMETLRWLLPENPEFNEDNGTYIWRAHWLFLLRGLLGPILLLVLGIVLIAIGGQLVLLEAGWVAGAIVALAIGFLAWAAWEVEDYRNDLYILSPTNVVDLEKKPFGPEDRRTASLGALNNISFETTFISNLLGYGNVVLETAGSGGKFTFNNVPNPRSVVAQINEYYVQFKSQEKERNMTDTLALLRHYHMAQQRHDELKQP